MRNAFSVKRKFSRRSPTFSTRVTAFWCGACEQPALPFPVMWQQARCQSRPRPGDACGWLRATRQPWSDTTLLTAPSGLTCGMSWAWARFVNRGNSSAYVRYVHLCINGGQNLWIPFFDQSHAAFIWKHQPNALNWFPQFYTKCLWNYVPSNMFFFFPPPSGRNLEVFWNFH